MNLESCYITAATDFTVGFDGEDSAFFRKLSQARIASATNDVEVV